MQFLLSWGKDGQVADLDCAVTSFDSAGVLLDVCSFDNTRACGGAVTHSGDNCDGLSRGVDEQVVLALQAEALGAVCGFVVTVHSWSGRSLAEIFDARLALTDGDGRVLAQQVLSGLPGSGVVAAVLHREDLSGGWYVRFVNTPATGKFFQEAAAQIRSTVAEVLAAAGPQLAQTIKPQATLAITDPSARWCAGGDSGKTVLTQEGDDIFVGSGPYEPILFLPKADSRFEMCSTCAKLTS